MKKKLLLFIIRMIRLFKAEEAFMPNLRSIPEGAVRHDRIYRYYGRILISRRWQGPVMFHYKVLDGTQWVPCTELHYRETLALKGPEHALAEREGDACSICACQKHGLPCRCDFVTGSNTGYYEIVHTDTQYSDNINL